MGKNMDLMINTGNICCIKRKRSDEIQILSSGDKIIMYILEQKYHNMYTAFSYA
ncbi:MAG: hypothetical protein K0S76_2052 [Herbinix sp.]|jgi:hypothetical protein|nr:hypothetical protein [Herbinix sp.]